MQNTVIYFTEFSRQNGDIFTESFPDYSHALDQLENWIPEAKDEANKWDSINYER